MSHIVVSIEDNYRTNLVIISFFSKCLVIWVVCRCSCWPHTPMRGANGSGEGVGLVRVGQAGMAECRLKLKAGCHGPARREEGGQLGVTWAEVEKRR